MRCSSRAQHFVEDRSLQRREEEARLPPVAPGDSPSQQAPTAFDVGLLPPETLRAEAVRQPHAPDLDGGLGSVLVRRVGDSVNPDIEAIAGQLAGPELVPMTNRSQHAKVISR